MSKPKPEHYNPEIGDVVIGKYAKLDGSVNPKVVVGYESRDCHDDNVITVDKDGRVYVSELKNLKYVASRLKEEV